MEKAIKRIKALRPQINRMTQEEVRILTASYCLTAEEEKHLALIVEQIICSYCKDMLYFDGNVELEELKRNLIDEIRPVILEMFRAYGNKRALNILTTTIDADIIQTFSLIIEKISDGGRIVFYNPQSFVCITERLQKYLQAYRSDIITNGYSEEPFTRGLLDIFSGVYDFRKLGIRDVERVTSKYGTRLSYISPVGETVDLDYPSGSNEILKPEEVIRIYEYRTKLLDLKLKVLNEIVNALHYRSAENLFDNCISLVTEALSFNDVNFLLHIDGLCANSDFITEKTID